MSTTNEYATQRTKYVSYLHTLTTGCVAVLARAIDTSKGDPDQLTGKPIVNARNMTSGGNDPPIGDRRRRSSLTEMFVRPSIDTTSASNASSNGPRTSSMASAMQQRTRRMSITSLGLSGSPNGNPANAFDSLRGSHNMGQPRAVNGDEGEGAVEDEDEVGPLNGDGSRPTSPSLGRRLSFGARAYRASSGTSSNGETISGVTSDASGGSPGTKGPSSPPGTRRGMCIPFLQILHVLLSVVVRY